jgi:hypothetical protein
MTDLLLSYRPLLLQDLRRVVDAVTLGHGAVLRQHALTNEGEGSEEPALMPALLCLFTCEVLGGRPEDALPAATSLAFLTRMADVFDAIAGADAGTDGTLIRSWGMPRSLNGGDAFFALAQASLLDSRRGGLDPERRFAAMGVLDQATRALSEKLYSRSDDGGGLFTAALALGALSAGTDRSVVAALMRFGASMDAGAAEPHWLGELPEATRKSLTEAAKSVSEAMR